MRDIGLIGPARSGKDTAGAHLVEEHGYKRVAFADPVRASMLALDPHIGEVSRARIGAGGELVMRRQLRISDVVGEVGWELAKDRYPEVRRLLQAYASEAVRDVVGADAWLKLGLDAHHLNNLRGERTVFTDVRFPNEVDALRAHGVRLVYVHRPGTTPANNHASETAVGMDDADLILPNRGSIADLYSMIATVIEE